MLVVRHRLIRLGDRLVPAWRLCAWAGLCTAAILSIFLSPSLGIAPAAALLSGAGALCAWTGYAALRARALGRSEHVLFAGLYVGAAGLLGAAWLLDLDLLAALDLYAIQFAAVMTWGRLGCHHNGCCRGLPSTWGVRYELQSGPAAGKTTPFLPVQIIESGLWLILMAAGGAMAARSPHGLAAGAVLSSYAMVRYALEGLRGDEVRPQLAGISQSRWLALPSLATGLYLTSTAGGVSSPWLPLSATAALVLLTVIARWWADSPAPLPLGALRELGAARPGPGIDHAATHRLPDNFQVEVVHHSGRVLLRATRGGHPLSPEEQGILLQAYTEVPRGPGSW